MITENFFIFNPIVLGLLVVLLGFLILQILRLKRRLDLFLRGEDKDFEKVLVDQIKKTENQEKQIKEILKKISRLDKISQKSFQKIGIIRFNPFKEVGSDQSFAIALLDAENNGFVLTSHYGRETNQIYLKSVFNGKSQYSLSEEEKKAIKKALES